MWWALWQIQPWDEERADRRAAIVAHVIANVNRNAKKRPAPFRVEDFMPYLYRDERKEAADLSQRLLAAFGLKPKAKPKRAR
jgi:hypothetical protein